MPIDTSGQPQWVLDLLAGSAGVWSWSGMSNTLFNITYSFDNTLLHYPGIATPTSSFAGTAAATQITNLFALVSNVANVTFSPTGTDLVVAYGTIPGLDGKSNTGVLGSLAVDSDIWLATPPLGVTPDFSQGSIGAWTVLHELLHSLGLSHPTGGATEDDTTVDGYSDLNTLLNSKTIPVDAALTPSGPMACDIAALQFLYGANTSYNAGATTYTWNSNTGTVSVSGSGDTLSGKMFCLWDGGGNDTLAISDPTTYSSAVHIDLRAGISTEDDGFLNAKTPYYSLVHSTSGGDVLITNAFPHDGTLSGTTGQGVIENASGANGTDVLFGNASDNILSGLGGNDVIAGFAGNDTLVGGEGADVLCAGAGTNQIAVGGTVADPTTRPVASGGTPANDAYIISMASGDSATATIHVTNGLPDGILSADNSGGETNTTLLGIKTVIAALANAGNQLETAGAPAQPFDIRQLIPQELTNEQEQLFKQYQDAGLDPAKVPTLQNGVEIKFANTIIGDFYNFQPIVKSDSGDVFHRYASNQSSDTVDGGSGTDLADYLMAPCAVTLVASSSTSNGSATASDPINDVLTSIENLAGSNHNDTITGGDGDNTLVGNLGSDTFTPSGGDDTYFGDQFLQFNGGEDRDVLDLSGITSALVVDPWAYSLASSANYTTAGSHSTHYYLPIHFSQLSGIDEIDLGSGNDVAFVFPNSSTDGAWTNSSYADQHVLVNMGTGTDVAQIEDSVIIAQSVASGDSVLYGARGMEVDGFDSVVLDHLSGKPTVTVEDIGTTFDAFSAGGAVFDYSAFDKGLTFSLDTSGDGTLTATDGIHTDTINYALNSGALRVDLVGTDHGDTYNISAAMGMENIWLGHGTDTINGGGPTYHYDGGDKTFTGTDDVRIMLDASVQVSDLVVYEDNFRPTTVTIGGSPIPFTEYDIHIQDGTRGSITVENVLGGIGWPGYSYHEVTIISADGSQYLFDSPGYAAFGSSGATLPVPVTTPFDDFVDRSNDSNAGTSTYSGGAGDDTFVGSSLKTIFDGGAGDDLITGGSANETLYGGFGDDTMSGGDGADYVHGGLGDDQVHGDAGDDSLFGEDGNDTLFGGVGGDVLVGGMGNDTLDGGTGTDYLWGNQGSDTFVVNASTEVDYIGDYNRGEGDVIHFTDVNLTVDTLGSLRDVNDLWLFGDGYAVDIKNFFQNFLQDSQTAEVLAQIGAGAQTVVVVDGSGAILGVDHNGGTNNADDISAATAGTFSTYGMNDHIHVDHTGVTAIGGTGADTYEIGADSYATVIQESQDTPGTVNIIDMPTGLTSSDISLSRTGDDLVISMTGGGTVTVLNDFGHGTGVQEIDFSNHTSLDISTLDAPIVGTSGADTMTGADVSGLEADTLQGLGGNDTLSGGSGNDRLEGGSGDDLYNFTAGLDTVNDTAGSDTISFSSGYNPANISYVVDGQNLDIKYSGTTIVHIENQFVSGDQIETLHFSYGGGSNVTLSSVQFEQDGTSGADNITGFTTGGSTNNLIYGMGGNDTIFGGSGNDTIDGGSGTNVLDGGSGDDKYMAGAGLDTITDASGSDTVAFSSHTQSGMTFAVVDDGTGLEISFSSTPVVHINDFFTSGNSIETLLFSDSSTVDLTAYHAVVGTSGDDVLSGLDNSYLTADVIQGLAGNDTLDGGAGDDRLEGGSGNDIYVHGAGMDTIQDTSGASDEIDFASGFNQADMTLVRSGDTDLDILFTATQAIHIEGQFTADGAIETLHFYGGGTLDLSTVDYTTDGTSGDDTLSGIDFGGGNDVINGLDGNDVIYGQSGNDTIDGGDGNDDVHGGAGDNLYIVTQGLDQITDEGGSDTVHFGPAYDPAQLTLERVGTTDLNVLFDGTVVATIHDQFTSDGKIETLSFDDTTTLDLSTVAYTTDGTDGNDILVGISTGGDPADIINGGDGNDTISGLGGDNTMAGGAGDDIVSGGSGNDVYVYESGHDTYTDTGGSDTINFGEGLSQDDMTLSKVNGADLEIDFNGIAAITIHSQFTSDGGIETLHFSDGSTYDLTAFANLITGTSSGETLYGTNDATVVDTIEGLGGNDNIYGYAGNDILEGGSGADNLVGGTGDDTYVFSTGFAPGSGSNDTVSENASEGSDTIRFVGIDPSDVRVWADGSNLNIQLDDSNHSTITIANGTFSSGITIGSVEQVIFDDGTVWNLTGGIVMTGSSSGETIYGTSHGDNIDGMAGNDNLYGYAGNDTITGGSGADNLVGGTGNDTYVFSTGFAPGSGSNDVVSENASEGTDTIHFTGIDPSDVRMWADGSNLNIQLDDSNHSTLTIANGTFSSGITIGFVEQATFDDGTVWDLTGGITMTGSSSGETIYGTSHDDNINGLGGNDNLYGYAGNDTITGGDGADNLSGGTGDDTYVFSTGFAPGSGSNDVVSENASEGTDTIHFTGIDSSDVRMWADGSNLNIQLDDSNHSTLTIANGTFSSGITIGSVEWVTFDDGTVWDLTGGITMTGSSSGETIYGTSHGDTINGLGGNDNLYGYAGNDTITGGDGADNLSGGTGDDTYVFSTGFAPGSGSNDTVSENASEGTDTIHFTGIDPSDVRMWADGSNLNIQLDDSNHSTLTIANGTFSSGITIGSVERVTFDDGTVWDLTGGITMTGSSSGETIYGTSHGDIINGMAGNDNLYGYAGDDTIIGGAGSDNLNGGTGNDTYVFATGWGDNDTINESIGEGTDTIIFSGLTSSQVHEWKDGSGNLWFQLVSDPTHNLLEVAGGNVENIVFSDTPWNPNLINDSDSANSVYGTSSDDTINGNGGNDNIYGQAGNDTIDGGTGADGMTGGTGDDLYFVDNVSDTVNENSGEGYDSVKSSVTFTLSADVEALTLTGTSNIDGTGNSSDNVLTGNSGNNTLSGGSGADTIAGGSGTDSLAGNSGNDTLDGGTGADTMTGGTGDDLYVVDNASDVVTENTGEGADTVQASVSYTLTSYVENLTLTGTGNINGAGNSDINVITGNGGNNTITGHGGNDSLAGGAGNDTYAFDNGDGADVVTDTAGNDTITFGSGVTVASVHYTQSGNDLVIAYGTGSDQVTVTDFFTGASHQIEQVVFYDTTVHDVSHIYAAIYTQTGTGSADTLTGTSGNDTLDGGAGADTLIGMAGDDVFIVDDAGDVVTESSNNGNDTVFSSVTYTLPSNVENLTLTGSGNIDGTGNSDANVLTGNSGVNILTGSGGNDTLDGGSGADSLVGGSGNDTYYVDNASDVVTEGASAGTDTVYSSVSFTLSSDVENLVLTGSSNINATGNSGDNTLTGNSGTNSLTGGAGDDTYVVGTGDIVTEGGSAGTDTDQSAISWTLETNVENLLLTGSSDVNGTGNSAANIITGNSGNNTLDGGSGADSMVGGGGNDLYLVDNTGDAITEGSNAGTDSVQSSVTYTLSSNVENLTLTGSSNIDGTGNSSDNVLAGNSGVNTLTGNDGNDTLDGGTGADSMIGGAGNDVYIVDNASDAITEGSSAGTDTVKSSLTYTLGTNVENLTLTGSSNIDGSGNSAVNVIIGNSGNNTLDGGSGADTMIGGAGNDSYIVDNSGDVIIENGGEGTDAVSASATYVLSANIETLTLTGSSNINGTGNDSANTITGNSGNNILDGGAGADSLIGGSGNDTYMVDNASDSVTEGSSAGTDTVMSSVSWTLGSNFENLTLTGTGAINGTGNSLDNAITGNGAVNTLSGGSGADTLDGGAGADTLIGGTGNDTYVIDSTADVIVENTSEGTDTVQSSVSYTLSASLENLTLTGTSAISGTGNASDNIITGNSGANMLLGLAGADTLDGGSGVDTMLGGTGNDTYVVDNSADVITENASEGTDLVQASASYVLSANVENLTLTGSGNINGTGNADTNILTGNSGNNLLDGGAGADTMVGGTGNDTYVVDNAGDVIVENASEGTDTVMISTSYTLSGNIENLTLLGTANLNGTGSSVVNVITGNSGNNSLDGAAGADSLIGGDGNDTYFVDNAGDVVTEGSGTGSGTDIVFSSVTYTLSTNVENLTLTGSSNIDGTGNSSDNIITGNSGVNTLTGNDGNDTLNGGAGADSMIGGAGNDVFIVDNASDVVSDSSGTDIVQSSVTWTLGSGFENLTLTGSSNIDGTGNSGDNILTSNSGTNTLTGGDGNDTYVVDHTADVVVEASGHGTDLVLSSVDWTLGSNVENLTLTGTDRIDGTGNSLDNILIGNTAANSLVGGAGNDTLDGGGFARHGGNGDDLFGGTGDDTYIIGDSQATVHENSAEGTDTVLTSVSHNMEDNVEILTMTGSGNINATGNSTADVITGNGGNNYINGAQGDDTIDGGGGNDTVYGDGNNDIIHGGSGNDILFGGVGTDIIHGDSGNDILQGNDGNDTLYGGDGLDTLYGAGGADTFVFEAASAYNNIDVVKDFNVSTDHDVLNIADLLTAYNPGTDTITDWVRISNSGSNSIVEVDRDGTGGTYGWTQVATLTGITGLTDEAALVTSGNLIVT
jgi:Ca2+-binding RTX toxin-like protein